MFQPGMILWNHLRQYIEAERQARAGRQLDQGWEPLAQLDLSSHPALLTLGAMAGIGLYWLARIAVLG